MSSVNANDIDRTEVCKRRVGASLVGVDGVNTERGWLKITDGCDMLVKEPDTIEVQ